MTQAAANAGNAARHALRGNSPLSALARAGYAAKGITYILIGLLAAKAAFMSGGQIGDSRSALTLLAGEGIFGQVLLWIVAVGLAAYALWCFARALINPEHDGDGGWKEYAKRVFYGISGVIHASLAFWAIRFLIGQASGGSGDGAESNAARVLEWPGGQWILGAVALCIIGYGVAQLVRAWTIDLPDKLDLSSMSQTMRKATVNFGRFGLAARGVVFSLVGFFLVQAAMQGDSSEAGGIGEALQTLGGFGNVILGVVALGLAAYGVFQLVMARYRRVEA